MAGDHSIYRTAVGELLFMAQDRADIKHATKECARELSAFTGLSMLQVKRIVKYAEGTAGYGTCTRKDENACDGRNSIRTGRLARGHGGARAG